MKSLNTLCRQNEKLLNVKAPSKLTYCCHCALNGYVMTASIALAVIPPHLIAEVNVNRKAAHVGFVVDKVALAQVFLQVLQIFSCQTSFHQCFPN
jgi:hypothetical protein